jgi:hypothetical protein
MTYSGIMLRSEKSYGVLQGVLSGLAAIFIAEVVFACPFLSGSKATGLAALVALFVESLLSPRFWIVGILLFGLFFAASGGSTTLRVLLFFWIPTLMVSALGFAFLGFLTYVAAISRRQ